MTATLADGKIYSGQFFQITTKTLRSIALAPLWDGWGGRRGWGGWGGWGYWGADPSPDFITHYSGRVVANLAAPSGAHLRCRFQLVRPSEGMVGGGSGQCQLPDGTTIDATFPHGQG